MAKYDITYSCGHDGVVNVIGPCKDREWKLERESEKMCPECFENHIQEEREKANKEAAEKAKEMELPELQGSEKQVSWANTIRQGFIQDLQDIIEGINRNTRINIFSYELFCIRKIENYKRDIKEIARDIMEYIYTNKTNASWYIDNRRIDIHKLYEEMKECENETKIDAEIIKDVKAESTIVPENAITNVAVEIEVKEDKIKVIFEKNDKFREIVKSLDYTWGNGYWYREISETTGTAGERAAELGNKLLNAGFPIMIFDEEIRKNAIEGKFELECNRWIYKKLGKDEGGLMICWKDYNDALYKKAKSLPGAKWDSYNSCIIVKIEHYKEVQDFARLMGFKFTKAALKEIELQIEKEKNIEVVTPAKAKRKEDVDGLEKILESGNEILDDLKDD